jgi:hypothetical protein
LDENYFGAHRVRGKRERGAAGKISVEKRRENFRYHCSELFAKAVLPVIHGKILERFIQIAKKPMTASF